MASNLQSRRLMIFGKRFAESVTVPSEVSSLRKGKDVHTSVYDKTIEEHEHFRATLVPDDVISSDKSEKYWAPHPQTGVFGPATTNDHHKPPASGGGGERGFHDSAGSVLEEKAFFRPLEDLDKPQQP